MIQKAVPIAKGATRADGAISWWIATEDEMTGFVRSSGTDARIF
jgi:hypothetical protein